MNKTKRNKQKKEIKKKYDILVKWTDDAQGNK